MKTKNIIKALEKIGAKVQLERENEIRKVYFCEKGRARLEFFDEAGEASCLHVQVKGKNGEIYENPIHGTTSPYLWTFYATTIKEIVKWLEK